MRMISRLLAHAGWVAFAVSFGSARAYAVMDWNEVALRSVVTARQIAPMTTRSMAMVHAAMFDAVNSIEQRYTPYKVKVPAEPGTSADAAVAASAHAVLFKLFPDQQVALARVYAPVLAQGAGRRAQETVA